LIEDCPAEAEGEDGLARLVFAKIRWLVHFLEFYKAARPELDEGYEHK